MQEVVLVFPHQLFQFHPGIVPGRKVVMIEEFLFFRQYRFHFQKLCLHRATMKFYQNFLLHQGFEVEYLEAINPNADARKLGNWLTEKNMEKVIFASLSDDWLERRLISSLKNNQILWEMLPSPGFINDPKTALQHLKKKRNYFQTDFYIQQRKQHNILLDGTGTPQGGKWTFDTENRKKLPKNLSLPRIEISEDTDFKSEAAHYIQQNFPNAYGQKERITLWPATFDEANSILQRFLQERFHHFGLYEDAMAEGENVIFHSLLSPALNCGLLTPREVLNKVLVYADNQNIPINSLEGLVRQILGWREFIHLIYHKEGQNQRTLNFWGFERKIPETFWEGTTGIRPVDIVTKRVLKSGYCHHIERLMILGNFMILCEFNPDEVYRWFMEMFIDAYDWVMVPNIYGMSQFADGGLMTTKPYISGSNYILKMGDWKKEPGPGEKNWTEIWDGLFWRFLQKQAHFFGSNPRMAVLLKTLENMPEERKTRLLEAAETFLSALDSPGKSANKKS